VGTCAEPEQREEENGIFGIPGRRDFPGPASCVQTGEGEVGIPQTELYCTELLMGTALWICLQHPHDTAPGFI